jgi:CRP-like cAMP-binding protein
MVSPELLRRYPFFAPFSEAELRGMALIADEVMLQADQVLFEENTPAIHLFLLLDGCIDLFTTTQEEFNPKTKKEFLFGEINPGEMFALSAVIEPYRLSSSARASRLSRVVRFEAEALRGLFAANTHMGYVGMEQVAKVLRDRLNSTRIQLAAAWS